MNLVLKNDLIKFFDGELPQFGLNYGIVIIHCQGI